MKKLISILAFMLLSAPAYAESLLDNTILGIAFINQDADIKISGPTTSASVSESGSGFGIYLDKYHKRKYRFNGTLSYITYDDFDVMQAMLSADYLIPVNGTVTFFAGASGGGALQQYSDASFSDSSLGFVYGAQAGAIAYINKNIMLELGYRARPTSIETEIESSPGTTTTVEDMSETYFSVLLMF